MITLYRYLSGPGKATDWDAKYRAEGPSQQQPEAYLAQHYARTILKHLTPGQSVLDAGCGTGGLLGFLQGRGFSVAGIDLSPPAIEIARTVVPQARLAVASVEVLPFRDRSFDAYLNLASWEYVEAGPGQAVREAVRVLKPDGVLVVVAPRANLLRRLFYLPIRRLHNLTGRLRGKRRSFLLNLLSRRDLRRLLSEVSFEIVKAHPHDLAGNDKHFGLWVDWPFLRGGTDYRLNPLGRLVKAVGNAVSPWTIAQGIVVVARRRV